MVPEPTELLPRACYYCGAEITWEHYPDESETSGCAGGWAGVCEACTCEYYASQSVAVVESRPTTDALAYFARQLTDLWRVLPVTWQNQLLDELSTTRHIALEALADAARLDPGRVQPREEPYLERAREEVVS
ncbi:MAG: hypothetical protein JXQ29_16390 [Planctomycetes bacterium]|nr:hypothetical protein [Planctomycetota bacterium]